jgi:hypothetical protein
MEAAVLAADKAKKERKKPYSVKEAAGCLDS